MSFSCNLKKMVRTRRVGGRKYYSCWSSQKLEEEEERLYSECLRECSVSSNLGVGAAIHGRFIKRPCSVFLQNHLLNMYMKCGHLEKGRQLFDEMPQRNVVSWSALISGFLQNGSPQYALFIFKTMLSHNTLPNSFTLLTALHASSFLSQIHSLPYQLYAIIIRLGFHSNVFLFNAFLTALIRRGHLLQALYVFDNFCNKDIVSWNAIMGGYLQYSYLQVSSFWFWMNCEGVKPDNFTFATVLTDLAASCDLRM